MKLSPRSVRLSIEQVLKTLAVRKLSEAVAIQAGLESHAHRPLDECPYLKPFAYHFARCPAYQPHRAIDLDPENRPVGAVWSCGHLQARQTGAQHNRWYAACALGDSASRARWAEEAGPIRVRTVNYLLHELAKITEPFAFRLWELKLDQARAVEKHADIQPATRSMHWLVNQFLATIDKFLSDRSALLQQYRLSFEGWPELAGELIEDVLDPRSPTTWDRRFDALLRFPADRLVVRSQPTVGSADDRVASKRATSDS